MRLLRQGVLFDIGVLEKFVRANIGDITFVEAFRRTGRILNITVTSTRYAIIHPRVFFPGRLACTHSPRLRNAYYLDALSVESTMPCVSFAVCAARSRRLSCGLSSISTAGDSGQLLNYLTAPHVLVWSAVLASCAIPGVYAPVELMMRDRYGDITPYHPHAAQWCDGTLAFDLPMQRLSELFNVRSVATCVPVHEPLESHHHIITSSYHNLILQLIITSSYHHITDV